MAAVSSCATLPSPTQRLLGKVALVTGGAAGIGESIVRLFHKHGAKVCLADINDNAGQRVCESLGGDPNICFLHCDVAKEDDVREAVDFAVNKFGTLDIMVNNAGVTDPPFKDIREVDRADLDKVLDTNVKGVFFGMKQAARIMIPSKKGSIISMCSAAVVIGGICTHAYTASKHAILGLTKNVAAELGKHGIRVNCVSPYGVATNMALAHVPEEERNDDAVSDFKSFITREANLKGVELTVEDVANAVLFLASDEARYISGENLVVDGGFASVKDSLEVSTQFNGSCCKFNHFSSKVIGESCLGDWRSHWNRREHSAFIPQARCKKDDVRRAVDFTVEKFGALDIMVNNAGLAGPPCSDIRNVDLSDFERVFDINVKGVFLGMKHAARIMIPLQKGSIISLCSVSSIIGGLGPHAYTGSKHAVLGLTKNVAAELGLHGIRVNCVSPYAVPTNLALAYLPEEERTEDAVAGFQAFSAKNANLKGVDLTADDVANCVLFLASDEARYISGDNLMVDGGFTVVNHSLRVFR